MLNPLKPAASRVLWTASLPLFLGLLLFIGVLLQHFHHLQNEVLDLYQKTKISQGLSVLLLDFSEENYHTQLEIWEYVVKQDAERLADFQKHQHIFMRKMNLVAEAFEKNQDVVDGRALKVFKLLAAEIPEIDKRWNKITSLVKTRDARPMQAAVEESESYFDRIEFNKKVDYVIQLQNERVAAYESEIGYLLANRNGIVGLALLLCFGLLVAVIHRKSLRAKENELQLIQASKLASLGELSAGLAHELNTPLMIIQGYNSRVQGQLKKENFTTSSPLWDYCKEIEVGAGRMKMILQHFRNFSRPAPFEKVPTPLHPAIQNSIALLASQARLGNVNVQTEFANGDLYVMGNNTRLEQVFLNIIKNALEAFEESDLQKEKILKVRTTLTAELAVVEFQDNGPGIAAKHKHLVFDPFFTTKPIGKGTGLGLSVSHSIIRELNGRLEVSSAENQGATFRVILPTTVESKNSDSRPSRK
jgi:signal transduction histidine kinase